MRFLHHHPNPIIPLFSQVLCILIEAEVIGVCTYKVSGLIFSEDTMEYKTQVYDVYWDDYGEGEGIKG